MFSTYSDDIEDMGRALTGDNYTAVRFLSDTAIREQQEMGAVETMLAMYDVTKDNDDRGKQKFLLADYLNQECSQLNNDAKAIVIISGTIKDPALAQTALKMKDDIRSAGDKLSAIWKSL
jgi:hypothetical protein